MYYPPEYLGMSPEEKARYIQGRGCGPDKGLPEWMVPDHLLGLCIFEACIVHDFMYLHGVSQADKVRADRIFYQNMLDLIDAAGGNCIIRSLRRKKAWAYYMAVVIFGKAAFYRAKQLYAVIR